MWSPQSQPNMALVGIKSVLSPRPASAPNDMEPLASRSHRTRHRKRTRDFESDSTCSSEPMDEYRRKQTERYVEEIVALGGQFDDVSQVSTDRSTTSTDYGSQDFEPGNATDHDPSEDVSSVDTAIDLPDHLFQEPLDEFGERVSSRGVYGAYRLFNQESKDSAMGSSTDGMLRDYSVDNQAASPSMDGAQNNYESSNESESSQGENLISHRTLQDENEENDNEVTDRDGDFSIEGGLSAEAKGPSAEATHQDGAMQTVGNRRRPLIPPSIVTFDLTTEQTDVLVEPSRSLQETVDLKLAEAQLSGHLDLANVGLPFFPSAILLSESSMIHRVSLQDNGLVDLPGAALAHLTCVTWLDLRYNELNDLPQEIVELTNLQVLLLQGNRLTALPAVLGTLSELTTLQVSDNPLKFPPQDIIRGGTRAILNFLKSQCRDGENLNQRRSSSSSSSSFLARIEREDGEDGVLSKEAANAYQEENPGMICSSEIFQHSIHEEERNLWTGDSDNGEPEEAWYAEEKEDESEAVCEENDEDQKRTIETSGGGDEGEMSEHLEHQRKENHHFPSERSASGNTLSSSSSLSGSLRVAIKNGSEISEYHLKGIGRETLDSGRDTLGRPQSPSTACLLTPNIDFPTRPKYDLTLDQHLHGAVGNDDCHLGEDFPSWSCECFKDSSPISKEKMKVINKISDDSVKHKLLKNLTPRQSHMELHKCLASSSSNPYGQGGSEGAAHRRRLHLRLQRDRSNDIEDDLESLLEGDIGEGYRRPHSEPLGDKEKECHRQISSEAVLPLPIVSLQLPSPRGPGCQLGRRCRRPSRRPSDVLLPRRNKPTGAGWKIYRDLQKPKLVTVSEVHRRAREERRRQREMLASIREMTACQRLKDDGELEVWREEARLMQLKQQQHYNLHPDSFMRAVCEAPFAVDGTMLTPRARAKLKPRDQKRSISPSVSDMSGVCAEVRNCLEELSQSSKGAGKPDGGGAAGGGGGRGGSLAHTASLVHQLNHLRRQLNRLRVNCVI